MINGPLFTIFGLSVYPYGLCIGIGLICCFVLLWNIFKKTGLSDEYTDFVTILGIVSVGGGFLSAALFQAIFNYIEKPSAGFNFSLGNITFIGGLIGGVVLFILGSLIFMKKYKESVWSVVAIAPICITIAHGFGRLGCLCAGCCYGITAEGDWAWLNFHFPARGNLWALPTQLYEAVFLLILCGVLAYLLLKKKNHYTMPIYLISYGVWRFLLEYIRNDHRGEFVAGLTPSQFYMLIMIALGVAVIFLIKYYAIPKNKMLPDYLTNTNAETIVDNKDK